MDSIRESLVVERLVAERAANNEDLRDLIEACRELVGREASREESREAFDNLPEPLRGVWKHIPTERSSSFLALVAATASVLLQIRGEEFGQPAPESTANAARRIIQLSYPTRHAHLDSNWLRLRGRVYGDREGDSYAVWLTNTSDPHLFHHGGQIYFVAHGPRKFDERFDLGEAKNGPTTWYLMINPHHGQSNPTRSFPGRPILYLLIAVRTEPGDIDEDRTWKYAILPQGNVFQRLK